MNETPRIEQFLFQLLMGDPALTAVVGSRVHITPAPQGTAFPHVVFNYQSGMDVQGCGTHRTMLRALYQVKVISKGSPDAAVRTAADRIDELVGKVAAATLNGYIFSGRRTTPIRFIETAGDIVFHHIGGLYRVEVYSAL